VAKRKEEYHEFRVEEVRHTSAKAVLFKLDALEEPVWVPKSQMEFCKDSMCIHISDWLVKQKPELLQLLEGKD
jgi:hypothetical protein